MDSVSFEVHGSQLKLQSDYFPYYFASAVRHVCVLGYNRPSGLLAIKSEKEKSAAVFAWWLVCISDGFRSVFHRLQSNL